MQVKMRDVDVKAVPPVEGEVDTGVFEAIVATWAVDSYGDKITPGAFADDLARWAESGNSFPIVWAHRWDDPFSHIGHALDMSETEQGLYIKAQIDDMDTNPTAAQCWRLLKEKRIANFSFAFDVIEGGPVQSESGDFYELRKLKIYEAGPCLIGVNQATELLSAKAREVAAEMKAGRTVSQANLDKLSAARDAITEVIDSAAVEPSFMESAKSDAPDSSLPVVGGELTVEQTAEEPKTDEPETVKADEVKVRRAKAVALMTILERD